MKVKHNALSNLRVLHLIPHTGRNQAGSVINLAACAAAQAASGCRVSIFSVARPSDGPQMEFDPNIDVTILGGSRWGSFRRCSELWERASTAGCDLIHSHGLWTDVNRLAMCLSQLRNIPHLLNPCGMLAPGALRHRWWKKAPARLWFQCRALKRAACLQGQSDLEWQHIRRFGLRNPIAANTCRRGRTAWHWNLVGECLSQSFQHSRWQEGRALSRASAPGEGIGAARPGMGEYSKSENRKQTRPP